jgi:NADH-quinone oxidoreductase subunit M
MNAREIGLMVPLIVVIIWLGVYPAPVLRRMESAVGAFVEMVDVRSAANAPTLRGGAVR